MTLFSVQCVAVALIVCILRPGFTLDKTSSLLFGWPFLPFDQQPSLIWLRFRHISATSIFPYAQWFCTSSLVPNCLLLLGYPLYGLQDVVEGL